MPMPMAAPGMMARLVRELAMALAAMEAVPKVATRPCTINLPTWNMPFSSPLGMPRRRMLRTIWGLKVMRQS